MKYRIKIINYSDGSVEYFAQKKVWLFWYYLNSLGGEEITNRYISAQVSRESSLERVDTNFNIKPTPKVTSIEFEYINK